MTVPLSHGQLLNGERRQKILIYRIGQLGDTIIALPALWAVRRAFPNAEITYLTSDHPGSGYVEARSVLPATGLIDEWLSYSLETRGRLSGMTRLWWALRRRHFDMLVYLAPRLRTRLSVWRDRVFFRMAGIRQVVGQYGFDDVPLRQPGAPLPMDVHEADHLLQRLALSELAVPGAGQGDMSLALSAEERQEADAWLQAHVPGGVSNAAVVGIGPGSKQPSKIWPEERFAEVGARLTHECGLYPVVFGGPADAATARRLLEHWGTGVSAAGVLGIRPAAAALARCRLFVGNDTGTMHLAAAVGTPCVAIFSAQDWPGRWHPYGEGHVVLRRSVPCEGCRLFVCIKEGMRCLREISTDDVLAACRTLLGQCPREHRATAALQTHDAHGRENDAP
jgi:ADP-heptose:LPS heptosyltransferase